MGDEQPDAEPERWGVSGTYFEACNCEAICPCRRVGSRPGGLSTEGYCDFALSWHVAHGRAGAIRVDGLDVVLAGRYVDDAEQAGGRALERWEVALYVDERATPDQAAALAASAGSPRTSRTARRRCRSSRRSPPRHGGRRLPASAIRER